jgi:hypothetical protein
VPSDLLKDRPVVLAPLRAGRKSSPDSFLRNGLPVPSDLLKDLPAVLPPLRLGRESSPDSFLDFLKGLDPGVDRADEEVLRPREAPDELRLGIWLF